MEQVFNIINNKRIENNYTLTLFEKFLNMHKYSSKLEIWRAVQVYAAHLKLKDCDEFLYDYFEWDDKIK